MKKAVLSLSGGMDSTSLLLKLLSEGYQVKAITIDYGQKHFVEVKKAKKMVRECLQIKNQFASLS